MDRSGISTSAVQESQRRCPKSPSTPALQIAESTRSQGGYLRCPQTDVSGQCQRGAHRSFIALRFRPGRMKRRPAGRLVPRPPLRRIALLHYATEPPRLYLHPFDLPLREYHGRLCGDVCNTYLSFGGEYRRWYFMGKIRFMKSLGLCSFVCTR